MGQFELIDYLFDTYDHFQSNIHLITKLFHQLNPRDTNVQTRLQWFIQYIDRVPLIYSFHDMFIECINDLVHVYKITKNSARVHLSEYIRKLQQEQDVSQFLSTSTRVALVSTLYQYITESYAKFEDLQSTFNLNSTHIYLVFQDPTVLQALLRLSNLKPWQLLNDRILFLKFDNQPEWNLPHQLYHPSVCIIVGDEVLDTKSIPIQPDRYFILDPKTEEIGKEFTELIDWSMSNSIWSR